MPLLGLLWCAAGMASAADSDVLTIPFMWSAAELHGRVFRHAAMLVPVDSRQTGGPLLQFDTGAQYSLVYSWARPGLQRSRLLVPIANEAAPPTQEQGGLAWSIDLHAREGHARVRAAEADHGAEGGPVGTLGADFIDGSLLVIDYGRLRIHRLRGAAQAIAAHCLFKGAAHPVDIEQVSNRVGLPVEVGGKTLAPVLFDTGASSFGLTLFDRMTWDKLGPSALPEKTLVISGDNTLQGRMSITSKVLAGPLCIGSLCIRRPEVGVLGFEAAPGFVGTFGNRDLGSGFIAIDHDRRQALLSRLPLGKSMLACLRPTKSAQATRP
jgi:hypothetical protein